MIRHTIVTTLLALHTTLLLLGQNPLLTTEQMKADLSIFRQIREKANAGLYRYQSKQTIDRLYQKAYQSIQHPLTITDFYKIIVTLTDIEGSNHNATELPKTVMDFLLQQKNFFPLPLKYVQGQAIVNIVGKEIPLGARILSINGKSDSTLMQAFEKYVATDGYNRTQKKSFSVNGCFGTRYLIENGLQDSFVVRYRLPYSNTIKTTTLKAVSQAERAGNMKIRHSAKLDSLIDANVNPKYSFAMLNGKTGLLNLRIFTMAQDAKDAAFKPYSAYLDSVFNLLDKNNTPHLIIDIRNNPGGNDPTYEEAFKYLTAKTFYEHTEAYSLVKQIPFVNFFFGTGTNQRYNESAVREMQTFLNGHFGALQKGRYHELENPPYQPKAPLFKGKVYLLIDENVASAASHFASLVRAYAYNATIVGVETSGGYYGHNGHIPFVYELPNSKILTKFSIVNVVQDAPPQPNQPPGRGVMPDHEVWQTFEDFMQQRDTQMEFVLQLITK
jgi:hypothetical protein